MQTTDQLTREFAIPGVLAFRETHPGMVAVDVTTAACTAQLYLQGAHLTQWQPAGQAPVLFLSERSAFAPGKAIRGGIPVVFPWFASPETSPVHPPAGSPSHGFARTSPWSLRFAAIAGDDVHLSLLLDPAPHREPFQSLQVGLDISLGNACDVRLTVANASTDPGAAPVLFEEALHTYLHVGDARQVSIEGLRGTAFLDKTDGFQRKTQTEDPLRFHGETDRMYLNTKTSLTLTDPTLKRRLHLRKTGSETTVIWNPATEVAGRLADLGADAWPHFACMETANAGENALRLPAGQAHTMGMHLSVEAL